MVSLSIVADTYLKELAAHAWTLAHCRVCVITGSDVRYLMTYVFDSTYTCRVHLSCSTYTLTVFGVVEFTLHSFAPSVYVSPLLYIQKYSLQVMVWRRM